MSARDKFNALAQATSGDDLFKPHAQRCEVDKPHSIVSNRGNIILSVDSPVVREGIKRFERDELYKHEVLHELGLKLPTIRQLVSMHDLMLRKGQLAVSIPELLKHGLYGYYLYDRDNLNSIVRALVERGVLERGRRKSYSCVKTFREREIVVYSFTRTGERVLMQYYEYMTGKHDSRLAMNSTDKVRRSYRGYK